MSDELERIKEVKVPKIQIDKANAYREKLSKLKFLDPACGSGNFLTETYLSLRRLENEAIRIVRGEQMFMDTGDVIKVSIGQFYGIEINDFAVTVAKTALWIAESQMMKETEAICQHTFDFLPLRSYANIIEGNALRLDWETVVPKNELNFIMGNPPFVGARLMSESQKSDMEFVCGNIKGFGNLDYVSAWYYKSADYMKGTYIHAALVSTNSISQGEQVPLLWKKMIADGVSIDFAHRTFRWDSEASLKAHVHCVIIGFSYQNNKKCLLFDNENYKIVESINPYLVEGPSILIESRKKPICSVNNIVFGSMPNDGGLLSDYSYEKMMEIVSKYPSAEPMFKPFLGAREFLHNEKRWCLWLKNISPSEIRKVKPIVEIIARVKQIRESSKRLETRELAEVPYLFGEIRQPENDYLIIPCHSSEKRKYIPMSIVSNDYICGNANLLLPDASLYQFGIMMSNVHNAWVKTVCGRIKSDFRYSANVVYNNFPWPDVTDEQKKEIESTARAILDARALYPDCSLADLYDDLTMPSELRKAHQANDKAVMKAYGFWGKLNTESACVAELMKMYQVIVDKK